MTEEEFLEDFNHAPVDEEEIAGRVLKITDNDKLVKAASSFLKAKEKFENALEKIGFEFG